MSTPAPVSPRHLVVLAGLTPQVITEALYILTVREEQRVARISVLTSPEGAEAVQNALLLTRDAPLERFCQDYGIPRHGLRFGLEDLYRVWPSRTVGEVLQPAFLDELMARLAAWCAEGELPITACVAGGRKDMVVLFAQVFSLLARPEDRLVHLLTSPLFENLAEFFYPPPQPATLVVHRAGGVVFLNSAEARVELLEIPLIRLRPLVDEESRRGLIPLEVTRQRVQREVESLDLAVRLVLRLREVVYRGTAVVLPPKEFAVLLFFARARMAGWGSGGWILARELDTINYIDAIEQAYRDTHGDGTLTKEEGFTPRDKHGGVNYEELKFKVTHAVSKIKGRLGAAHPGRVQSRAVRGGREYGLDLDPGHLHINEA